MKIVIADDEHLVRLGLVSMIHEMETSWEVMGEAADGEELVELVTRYQPDAAIVDIRMPGMNGIEAIRRAKISAPQTKWIILTGYSDFQYAKQAVGLGVSEYLLKPVNPIDLEKAISSISRDNKQYLYQLNQQFENQLYALFHGLVPLEAESEDSLLRNGKFQGSVCYIDSSASPKELEVIQGQLIAASRRCIQQHVVYGGHIALFTLPKGEMVTVGVWDPLKPEARKRICAYFHALEAVVRQFRSDSTAITIVHTEEIGGFLGFHRQIGQIQEISCYRIIAGMNRGWLLKELQNAAISESASLMAGKKLCQLAQAYKNKLYMNFQTTLEELELLWQKETLRMKDLWPYLQTVFQIPGGEGSEQEADDFFRKLRKMGDQLLLQKQHEAHSFDLVDHVLAYTERNYMKNIGIGQIAGELNVTQSYLSTIFHKKTGTTFVKYLTRIRILKAKELLMESKLNIQEIAEQVGYYSTRHFTKLFTEIVGVYPSDFKKSMTSQM
ncbi:response regulator [Paenibacillus sp. GCM10027628]|uniref:response regulator transcription factor n=1 Tax=Paenibacillus sp. GCM10027628 TaxID=3273413 RepID=UPI00363D0E0F